MKLRDIEKVFNIKPRECQRLESHLRFYKSMGHYCEKNIYVYVKENNKTKQKCLLIYVLIWEAVREAEKSPHLLGFPNACYVWRCTGVIWTQYRSLHMWWEP